MTDPATLSAGCILVSLVLYTLLGGADFGGGVWALLARGPRAADRRRIIAGAIGPVWETNHVWLIAAIVILFTAFPRAFAVVSTVLFVPMSIVLAGIFLGIVFGAISSGRIRAAERLAFTGDVRVWLSPFPISVGLLALASFAFLAAVYLILETKDPGLREELRRDAFRSAAVLVLLSGLPLATAAVDAKEFFRALTG